MAEHRPDPFDRRAEVRHGVAEEVVPGVRRVTCANPSPMTFTGTQSYLVGRGEVALIDPGPADPAHFRALRAALGPGERITHVIVTHTHLDHSPGAAEIAAATGARVFAFGPHGRGMREPMRRLAARGAALGGGEGADRAFRPDHILGEGETVEGRGWALTALHTPGHLSNHLSLVLEGTGVLFTGDTVMGWATTLVSPPEGDMAAFMATLERLRARAREKRDRLYLPGHGHPVTDPLGMVAWQIAHRHERRAQVLAALAEGPADPAALARRIYADVDPALLPAAARNVLATLLWLAEEEVVRPCGEPGPATRFERIG